jgi:hypothetical protein
MSFNPTDLLTKKETIKQLKISRARYEQFIESGILPKPFEIAPGSRLYHSPAHLDAVERNLYERAIASTRNRTPRTKPTKPFSEETKAQILRARK